MRCLALAGALRRQGAHCLFLARGEMLGVLAQYMGRDGHQLLTLPEGAPRTDDYPDGPRLAHAQWLPGGWRADAHACINALNGQPAVDWLVVDHYALDARWEREMRAVALRIMTIDDLADRNHDADLLLDQNLITGMETRYDRLVPPTCTCLLGPRHALLRPQFAGARERLRARDGSVRRVLVFFGGGESGAEILKAAAVLRRLNKPEIAVDIIANQADHVVTELVRSELPEAVVHGHIEDVASLMAAADLNLGAAGSTSWERCCLGLPAVTLSLAANQDPIGLAVGEVGAARHLGRSGEVTVDTMEGAIRELIEAPAALARMSARGLELVDGLGTSRVSIAMQEV